MNTTAFNISRRCGKAGYSLIEVLVAASILVVGVSAAAKLSLVMVTQDEINQGVSVALAQQEIAIRMYQLGLNPAEIAGLLPNDPNVASLDLSVTGTTAVVGAAITPVDYLESTLTINSTPAGAKVAGQWNGGGDAAAPETRTTVVRGYRYANRYR